MAKMAEGGTKGVLCRYFMNGACKEGDICHFSHNREQAKPSSVCRYYLRGCCNYGERCRYDHLRPEYTQSNGKTKDASSKPSSQSTSASQSSASVERHVSDAVEPSYTTASSSSSVQGRSWADAPEFVHTSSVGSSPGRSWADAPEFIPKTCVPITEIKVAKPEPEFKASYAQVAGADIPSSSGKGKGGQEQCHSSSELCPYYLISLECQFGDSCSYVHGLLCEVCQLACLHPFDEEQRKKHMEECNKLIEAEMEHSFAVARSREKICGICMDTVMERRLPSQRRFGILPNCSHCFCLDCIRTWRKSKQFENKIIRSCPECRVQSDYVIPSHFWVDDKDKEDKDKLIVSYHKALSDKACKYFNQGNGQCPFGNKCFYLHALADGTKKDVGPPVRRRRFNADGELQFYLDHMELRDFVEEHEQRLELLRESLQYLILELELEEQYFDDSVSEASDIHQSI